jgi:hypothetical protein
MQYIEISTLMPLEINGKSQDKIQTSWEHNNSRKCAFRILTRLSKTMNGYGIGLCDCAWPLDAIAPYVQCIRDTWQTFSVIRNNGVVALCAYRWTVICAERGRLGSSKHWDTSLRRRLLYAQDVAWHVGKAEKFWKAEICFFLFIRMNMIFLTPTNGR